MRQHWNIFPDLASADFYPFPRLKSALTGWRFCDATEIIMNATEGLKRFHKMDMFSTLLQPLAEVYIFF
jgi:hypothetical protein